jgi:hypothetical protein
VFDETSAMKFDPDRFLDERLQKYLIPNPYIFCPFNAGPRICLGQQVDPKFVRQGSRLLITFDSLHTMKPLFTWFASCNSLQDFH